MGNLQALSKHHIDEHCMKFNEKHKLCSRPPNTSARSAAKTRELSLPARAHQPSLTRALERQLGGGSAGRSDAARLRRQQANLYVRNLGEMASEHLRALFQVHLGLNYYVFLPRQ